MIESPRGKTLHSDPASVGHGLKPLLPPEPPAPPVEVSPVLEPPALLVESVPAPALPPEELLTPVVLSLGVSPPVLLAVPPALWEVAALVVLPPLEVELLIVPLVAGPVVAPLTLLIDTTLVAPPMPPALAPKSPLVVLPGESSVPPQAVASASAIASVVISGRERGWRGIMLNLTRQRELMEPLFPGTVSAGASRYGSKVKERMVQSLALQSRLYGN